MKLFKLTFALPVIVTLLQPSVASANFLTGNDLYRSCSAKEDSSTYYQEQARCYAYVIGAYDTLDLFGQIEGANPIVFTPNGLVANQAVDIVIADLKNRPEHRHLAGSAIVMMALSQAFPCKKQI